MPRTASSDIANKAVGEEIRQTRKALGLTQAEVARRLRVDPSYVTNVEAGRENLTIGQLANVAAALGTSMQIRLPVVPRETVTVPERPAALLDRNQ